MPAPGSRVLRYATAFAVLLLASLTAGCLGGGSSSSTPTPTAATPGTTPSASPTTVAVTASGSPNPSTGSLPAAGALPAVPAVLPTVSGATVGASYSVIHAGRQLLAGTESYGVLASSDGGAHWHAINDGLPENGAAVALCYAGDLKRVFAIVSGSVYSMRSTLPFHWTPWGRSLPKGSTLGAITYWAPAHRVLVGDGIGTLLAANAANAAWIPADTNLPVGRFAIAELSTSAGRIYAGLEDGLYTSGDGHNWTYDLALGPHQVTGMAPLPPHGMAVSINSDGLALRPTATAAWRIFSVADLGLPAGERIISVTYDRATNSLYLGTNASGVRALSLADLRTRPLIGIEDGNSVNGLLSTGTTLVNATNAGLVRVPLS